VPIKRWNIRHQDEQAAGQLSEKAGLPILLSRVLCARGHTTPEAAKTLAGEAGALASPYRMKDMEKAVARIRQAIEEGEKIAVFGDYDCDGVTATALMTSYLQAVGADVIYSVPEREKDGYGLSTAAVDFLHSQGVSLIITVDNGISSYKEIEYASGLGMEAVITDHHAPPEIMPAAVAVVNPHRADCESGLTELSGVGVAFKLVCALEEDETGEEILEHYADLVMIGTVADVVPLVGENRTIVRAGLAHLADAERVGLSALLEKVGATGKAITTETVSFTIVPRINAVGRMGPVDEAIELLLTDDFAYAWNIAGQMDEFNVKRKEIEDAMFEQACAKIAANPDLLRERVLIVSGENWHHGVVGIVASRIMERTGKPSILLSLDEREARGSARSVPGFSMIEAVSSCSEHLTRFGGHPLAAGMTLLREDYEAFYDAMQAYAQKHYRQMPPMSIEVDCPLLPSEISGPDIAALSMIEPFGAGNSYPCFLLNELKIERITPISQGKHIRIGLTGEGLSITVLYFRMSAENFPYSIGDMVDIVANVSLSEYQGKRQISIIVRDLRRSGIDQEALILDSEAYACFIRREGGGEVDLLPDREEIATVYRFLRKEQSYRHGPTELYYRLRESGISYAKVLVTLDVLAEMGLAQIDGSCRVVCTPNPPKVDLEDSAILRGLAPKAPIHN